MRYGDAAALLAHGVALLLHFFEIGAQLIESFPCEATVHFELRFTFTTRRARTALTAAQQICDLDDADVAERLYDVAEALGACEHELRLGSAAPAPVAEVA